LGYSNFVITQIFKVNFRSLVLGVVLAFHILVQTKDTGYIRECPSPPTYFILKVCF
jgi:hypothetical protein